MFPFLVNKHIILSVSTVALILGAQIPALGQRLQQLTPSYSHIHSYESGFLSNSIINSIKQDDGRLWLLTDQVSQRLHSIYGYQFDGRKMLMETVIQDSVQNLGMTDFTLLDDENRLIGLYWSNRSLEQSTLTLKIYDPVTKLMSGHALEGANKPCNSGNIAKLPDGRFAIHAWNDESQYLFIWDGKELKCVVTMSRPQRLERLKLTNFESSLIVFQNELWLATSQFDVLRFDMSSWKFVRLDVKEEKLLSIVRAERSPPQLMIHPRYGLMACWLGSKNLLYYFDEKFDRFLPFSESAWSNHFQNIALTSYSMECFGDDVGNVLVTVKTENEYKGLLLVADGREYDYSLLLNEKGEIHSVWSEDLLKEALLGTSRGLEVLDIRNIGIENAVNIQNCRSIVFPNDSTALVKSNINALYTIDMDTLEVRFHRQVSCAELSMLCMDENRDTWFAGPDSISKYNFETGDITKWFFPRSRNMQYHNRDSLVVVNSDFDVFLFQVNSNEIVPIVNNGDTLNLGTAAIEIVKGEHNNYWLCTNNGVFKVNIATHLFSHFSIAEGLTTRNVSCVLPASDGKIWIGTAGGGVHILDETSGKFFRVNRSNGLSNDMVTCIMEDSQGDKWVGTYHGLNIVGNDGNVIRHLYESEGLYYNELNRQSHAQHNGIFYIGGLNGVNVFDPIEWKRNKFVQQDLQIYFIDVDYSGVEENTSERQQLINNRNLSITLPANERKLSLSFSLSSYVRPELHNYAYRFPDRDSAWTFIGANNVLTLDNLQSGDYILEINGHNDHGNWARESLKIKLHVRLFFYQTWWFYALCLIPFIVFAWLWVRRQRGIKAELERKVKERTEKINSDKILIENQANELIELDKVKDRFFTNISHEFRTPLSVINGMADLIKNNPQQWSTKGSNMIAANTKILLDLVNQILDLRKLESHEMKLHLRQQDIVSYLKHIHGLFEPVANANNIRYFFESEHAEVVMDFDSEKVLRVVSNLLSNAIKFTNSGGEVKLKISVTERNNEEALQLEISDTGIGIPEDELDKIFLRFYQSETDKTKAVGGSGIGLDYVKQILHFMKGEIEVKSKLGEGSTFMVWLPIHTWALLNDEKIAPSEMQEPSFTERIKMDAVPHEESEGLMNNSEPENLLEVNDSHSRTGRSRLLIIEDNKDVSELLVAMLGGQYTITTAFDGQQGIEKALDEIPDIILSDVMMPQKDGFAVVDFLKNDLRTSHIPIVLLTAKAAIASRIDGLKRGADDYISKPFHPEELSLRLRNIMAARHAIRLRYANGAQEPISQEPELVLEDAFVLKVQNAILKNLEDSEYGIEKLCGDVAMSRSQLHNKLKALTGLSTSHFVRGIRLNEGHRLLTTSNMRVNEVAYAVGFDDPSYFSKLYKIRFGKAPSS